MGQSEGPRSLRGSDCSSGLVCQFRVSPRISVDIYFHYNLFSMCLDILVDLCHCLEIKAHSLSGMK